MAEQPTYWVIASGDGDHDASDFFLRYGFVALGPGEYKRFSSRRYGPERSRKKILSMYNDNGRYRRNCYLSLKRFADDSEMRIGDYVLLRRGASKLVAIGRIKSNYLWLEQAEDICGWDLQHVRRIDWTRRLDEEGFSFNTFYLVYRAPSSLRQLRRLSKLSKYFKSTSKHKIPPTMPKKGGAPGRMRGVLKNILWRANYFYDYESINWGDSEQDIIHFLILPLLETLGWTHKEIRLNQYIKKRGKHPGGFVDIILLNGEKPHILIEAKYLSNGLDLETKEQASGYVQALKRNRRPEYYVLSDGEHYYAYKTKRDEVPTAYLDIRNLYAHHPIDVRIKGYKEFFRIMRK